MSQRIEDLLHRRSDVSAFLVHLTRDIHPRRARQNLLEILATRTLLASTPMGVGSAQWDRDPEFRESQRVVCFTETPLEHVWMMCEDISGRAVNMQPYGLAVTKSWARRRAVNPVFYVDITRGHDWLTNAFDELLNHAVAAPQPLATSAIARLLPFVEPMGQPASVRREFSWEREWRHVGDLTFGYDDLVVVFVPESDHDQFASDINNRLGAYPNSSERRVRLIDPRWGQTRMLSALANVADADLGPFPR
jgi:hypothetical protein